MARLDVFLKNSGLYKARTQAKRACDEGQVRLGGVAASASHSIVVGDVLEIDMGRVQLKAEILEIPQRPVPRGRRNAIVRVLGQKELPEEILSFDDEPEV